MTHGQISSKTLDEVGRTTAKADPRWREEAQACGLQGGLPADYCEGLVNGAAAASKFSGLMAQKGPLKARAVEAALIGRVAILWTQTAEPVTRGGAFRNGEIRHRASSTFPDGSIGDVREATSMAEEIFLDGLSGPFLEGALHAMDCVSRANQESPEAGERMRQALFEYGSALWLHAER